MTNEESQHWDRLLASKTGTGRRQQQRRQRAGTRRTLSAARPRVLPALIRARHGQRGR